MKKYVVGFLIDVNWNVVLIRKNKPDWQAGKLNGVGGKIEDTDVDVHSAMEREFEEEAGVIFREWNLLTKVVDESVGYELYVFRGFVDDVKEIPVKSMTSEIIEVHNIMNLYDQDILPSAMWMIHMCMDHDTRGLKLYC